MKDYLIRQGFDSNKLISLGLFDYLTEEDPQIHLKSDGVTIAGNLDHEKCGYVNKFIEKYSGKFPIHLYGKGIEEKKLPDGVLYHGIKEPDVLPGQIEGGFGLVWDGDSLFSCSGSMGEYLRYNNPHKTSLYIASGIPIITWKEAAIGKLIDKEKIGFTVESLIDLESIIAGITQTDYLSMLENVMNLRNSLQSKMLLSVIGSLENR